MSVDIEAVAVAASAIGAGFWSWMQSRRADRRSDFQTITDRLDRELKAERRQRRLLTAYVLELRHWAARVPNPPSPVPQIPPELDLSVID